MTDQRDSVTAADTQRLLQIWLDAVNAGPMDNKINKKMVERAIAGIAALRRERDEARETDDGWKPLHAEIEALRADIAKKDAALRKALNYIENTEGELGITLYCGDAIRDALAPAAQPSIPRAEYACDHTWGHNAYGAYCTRCGLAPAAQGEVEAFVASCKTLDPEIANAAGNLHDLLDPAPAPSAGETVLVPQWPSYKQLAWISNAWTCTIEEAAETYGDLIDYLAAAPTTGEPT